MSFGVVQCVPIQQEVKKTTKARLQVCYADLPMSCVRVQ